MDRLFPALKPRNSIWVHGHRGSAATHPENSFHAIEEALKAGADFFEVDVHLTEDDVAVIFHDKTVNGRVCRNMAGERVSIPIPVRDLKVADLDQYDCGQAASRDFPNRVLFPNTKIPTLEAVLHWMQAEAPALGINIEVKVPQSESLPIHPEAIADRVVTLIRQYDLVHRAQFQSFNSSVLRTARQLCPELAISLLCHNSRHFVQRALGIGASAVGPYYKLLNAEKVQECHRSGLLVVPYTVNEEEDWRELLNWGVDGIITDYPRKLVSFLKQYNKENAFKRTAT